MFAFKLLPPVLCAAAASAWITSIAPLEGTFQASNASTLTLRFLTENTQSPVFDWFAAVGVMPAQPPRGDPSALGLWVANIDFAALGKDLTGNGNFTVDVPVNTDNAIFRGSAQYILTAAIMEGSGVSESATAKFLNLTFEATVLGQ
ncbi:hypothetical protein AURDEDRAFT_168397 [Auricularia subglabra TFB-10046 SS5]|nr:hypothetical protein AURDEDRAFT_168397 [Auricularia subglabra TFB-10046 SS5]